MTDASSQAPGLYFEAEKASADKEPLRTDIAGFIGPTERGPVGHLTRVEGWRDYVTQFGGETQAYDTPFCLRGYFENGGEAAYIVRVLGDPHTTATAVWEVDHLDQNKPDTDPWLPSSPAAGGFVSSRYTIEATSPGSWADGLRVSIDYMAHGRNNEPQLTLKVVPVRGQPEYLTGVSPAQLEQHVAERSNLIRITAIPGNEPGISPQAGPSNLIWNVLVLENNSEEQSLVLSQYIENIDALFAEPEAALIALPDMYQLPASDASHLLAYAAAQADASLDRQIIATLPMDERSVNPSIERVGLLRQQLTAGHARSVAVYQPWLDVKNPLGGVIEPLRRVPPVGHVAGLISRLDRERGAHHTPANAILFDTVDASEAYDALEQGQLVKHGLNPLRCRQGRGIEVWGGRTLADQSTNPEGLYLAHRRLIHRLVRAIHRVAQPLVFNTNGPKLWLVLVRAITTVLMQAYRAGALKGEIPAQAFRVTCNESNNPIQLQELGQVHCEIQVAPAVPMEFITLRIAISSEGRLEVINA